MARRKKNDDEPSTSGPQPTRRSKRLQEEHHRETYHETYKTEYLADIPELYSDEQIRLNRAPDENREESKLETPMNCSLPKLLKTTNDPKKYDDEELKKLASGAPHLPIDTVLGIWEFNNFDSEKTKSVLKDQSIPDLVPDWLKNFMACNIEESREEERSKKKKKNDPFTSFHFVQPFRNVVDSKTLVNYYYDNKNKEGSDWKGLEEKGYDEKDYANYPKELKIKMKKAGIAWLGLDGEEIVMEFEGGEGEEVEELEKDDEDDLMFLEESMAPGPSDRNSEVHSDSRRKTKAASLIVIGEDDQLQKQTSRSRRNTEEEFEIEYEKRKEEEENDANPDALLDCDLDSDISDIDDEELERRLKEAGINCDQFDGPKDGDEDDEDEDALEDEEEKEEKEKIEEDLDNLVTDHTLQIEINDPNLTFAESIDRKMDEPILEDEDEEEYKNDKEEQQQQIGEADDEEEKEVEVEDEERREEDENYDEEEGEAEVEENDKDGEEDGEGDPDEVERQKRQDEKERHKLGIFMMILRENYQKYLKEEKEEEEEAERQRQLDGKDEKEEGRMIEEEQDGNQVRVQRPNDYQLDGSD